MCYYKYAAVSTVFFFCREKIAVFKIFFLTPINQIQTAKLKSQSKAICQDKKKTMCI